MEKIIDEILKKISTSEKIILSAHTNPDADAIGSCLAFALKIKSMGKTPIVALEQFDERFKILPGQEFVVHDNIEDIEGDLFISLDCATEARLGKAEIFIKKYFTINIDHHHGNTNFGNINYIIPDFSSTSEMVYNILKKTGINKDIASAIYAGIIGDTGGLRHPCTTIETMEAVTELFKLDIPFSKIYNLVMGEKSVAAHKLLGRAIEKSVFLHNGKVLYSGITKKDIEEFKGTYKDLDMIVSELISVRGVKIAFFIYEKEEGSFKVSFRAKDEYNVCAVANVFGGGGHIKAAGCTISLPFDEVIEKIKEEIDKLF